MIRTLKTLAAAGLLAAAASMANAAPGNIGQVPDGASNGVRKCTAIIARASAARAAGIATTGSASAAPVVSGAAKAVVPTRA